MARLLHENSSEALNESLDLFSVPATQVSIENTQTTIVTPDHIGNVIEIKIPSLDGYYLDLASCFMKLVVTIKKSSKTALAAGDKVAFVNNIFDSLFKQVDVFFGTTLINNADNNHAHKAYLYHLLNTTPQTASNYMTSQGFIKDTSSQMESTAAANEGFTKRKELTAQSKDLELIGRIRHGIFEQPRFLIDGVDVKLKMTRNSDDFCIHRVTAKTGVVVIKSVEFHARQVKIADAVLLAHKDVLAKTPAKYPYTRLEMSDHSFPAATTTIQKDIISGILPTRIVFGFVNTSNYNGHAEKNPFNFINCSITNMSVNINGHQLNGREFHFDFEEDNGNLEGFIGLFESLGKWDTETPFTIERDDYKNGYTLFGFDLTPDKTHGCFQLERSGTVSLSINCTVPAGGATLLVMKEYQSLLQIDSRRKIWL